MKQSHSGFTIVELLVVISIILALVAIGLLGFINYSRYQQYQVSVVEVYETLREARSLTLGSDEDTTYGVHLDTDEIVLFSGGTFVSGDISNIVRPLSGVTVSSTLSGGVDDIVFSRRTGTTSSTGIITITSGDATASTTITVSGTGVIQLLF